MKKTTLILLMFVGISSYAQQPGIYTPGTVSTYGEHKNRLKIDSVMMLPTGCGKPTSLKWHSNDSSLAALQYDTCNKKFWFWDPKLRNWYGINSDTSAHTKNADSLQHIIGTNYILYGGTNITIGSSSYSVPAGWKISSIDFYDPVTINVSIGTAVNLRDISPLFTVSSGSWSSVQLNKIYQTSSTIYFNGVTSNTVIKIYRQ